MAFHQLTTVDGTKLVLGNYKIETAASVAAAYVNLGAGIVSAVKHNMTMYDVQAGNAPDPIEGVSEETFTVDMELMEYDGSVLSAAFGGIILHSATASVSTVTGGGMSTMTPRVFRLTNTRIISSVTKQTVITIFKATMSKGLEFTPKSDNDSNPIQVMPMTIEGTVDSARTAGSQLYSIVKDI